jgi:hypothetical protein
MNDVREPLGNEASSELAHETIATVGTILCVDGSGNKNEREANLKRPVYQLDVGSSCITRLIPNENESVCDLFKRLIDDEAVTKPILIAADLVIGLPASRPSVFESVEAQTFLHWLKITSSRLLDDKEHWRGGLIADSVSNRTDLKPFVSIGKGEKAADVSEKRRCDVACNGESVYCVDHGGKQVGKAAMQFWFEVMLPLREQYGSDLGVWPFESIEEKSIVVGECYPAECQRVVFGRTISKRNPLEVAKALSGLVKDEDGNGRIGTTTWIHAASSEDEFDMFTTAFAFRTWLQDGKDVFWCPEECKQMEGWILGLDRTEPLPRKKKSRSKSGPRAGSRSVPVGDLNTNTQRNLGPTDEKGPKGTLYRMKCERPLKGGICEHEYLTNAQDVFHKRCPECDGGK